MSPQTENEAEPILNKNKFQKCQLPYPVRLCSWTYDYTAIGLRKILNLSTRPVLSTFWYEDVSVTTSFFSTFINKHFLNDHRVSGTMLSSEVQCQASPPAPHSTQMPPFKISSPLLNPFRILSSFYDSMTYSYSAECLSGTSLQNHLVSPRTIFYHFHIHLFNSYLWVSRGFVRCFLLNSRPISDTYYFLS